MESSIKGKTRVLIVGAGVAGRELLGELRKHLRDHYEVVGFVDDDPGKLGVEMKGVTVLGGVEDLERLVRRGRVAEVFIAIPSAQGSQIRRVVDKCEKVKVVFRIVPRILEIVRGRVKLAQVREIQVEDLLGRAIVKAEQQALRRVFREKKVLVTGAAGSIGSELCRQLVEFGPKRLMGIDWWENGMFELESELNNYGAMRKFEGVIGNVQDEEKVKQVMEEVRPDLVFHAAAFKHVPLMQRYPEEAVKNNVWGTEVVARAAYRAEVKKCVFISTDKAAEPVSVMGATKLVGERIVSKYNQKGRTKFLTVRFGNVLESAGSVVPIFKRQIASGGPVTVTDRRMVRYFMTIPEAVQLVLQATILGKGGEVFVLDMGEPVKILDLAKLMIRVAGFVPGQEMEIKFIGERGGEKLSEKLVGGNEELVRTAREKIYMIKKNGEAEKEGVSLARLKRAAEGQNREAVMRILRRVAPDLKDWRS